MKTSFDTQEENIGLGLGRGRTGRRKRSKSTDRETGVYTLKVKSLLEGQAQGLERPRASVGTHKQTKREKKRKKLVRGNPEHWQEEWH